MQQPTPNAVAAATLEPPPDAVANPAQGGPAGISALARDRRDRRGGKPQRPEKSDRKATRRSNRPAIAPDSPGVASTPLAASEATAEADSIPAQNGTEVPGATTSGALAGAGETAVAVIGETADEPASTLALASEGDPTMLVAPLVDTSSGQKLVERTRAQFHAAESAVAGNTEVISVIAPLIRHVNGVTEQLNEAQLSLGRAMAERDALRQQLAELRGVDVSQVSLLPAADPVPGATDRQSLRFQRIENRGAETATAETQRRFRIPNPLGVDALANREEMSRVARRRQLLAIAIFGAIGIALYMHSRQGNDISKVSRDSLADLQFVGVFFNMFFMVWMLYRVVRVGGKGAKWLFPQNNNHQRRH